MSFLAKVYLIIDIVLYFVVALLFIVVPEYYKFNLAILLVAFIISCLLILKYRKLFKQAIKSYFFKQLSSNLITLFLTFCILAMINFLVVRNDRYIDLTRSKIHTLSDQSLKALKLLQGEKIQLKLFAKRADWGRYLKLLQLYKNHSANLGLDFYDVDKELALINLYDIKEEGTLIIEYNNSQYKTVAKNELAVTNLLYKILRPNKKIIYYSVGHNEMSLDDKNSVGANFLKEKILNSHFVLKPIELQKGIPKNASAVMILNPQIEFLPLEIKTLSKYIEKGGSLITTLAPSFNGLLIQNYIKFLNDYGIDFNNVLILDRLAAQQGSQASIPVVNTYDTQHEITKNMNERTLFPVSGAFKLTGKSDFTWKILAKSTPFPASWGESSFDEVKMGKAKFNEGDDLEGPLNIFMAGEKNKSRIIAFTSSAFISNQFQGQSNNFNLFINALSWGVRDDNLISLTRPSLEGNLVYLSKTHLNTIFYFSILIFPFLFFGAAIFAFRRKTSG